MQIIKTTFLEEDAVTSIEYSLLGALIAIVIIIGTGALGTELDSIYQKIAACVNSPTNVALCKLVA